MRKGMRRVVALRRGAVVEPLEPRLLLSGNVVAYVAGGSLFVTGDDAGNDIGVQNSGSGQFQVSSGPSMTNVNGDASTKTFNDVTGGIWLTMNGGDDTVHLQAGTAPGDVYFFGGAGNNEFDAALMSITGGVSVFNSTGNDTVTFESITVARGIMVDNGSGTNSLYFHNFSAAALTETSSGVNTVTFDSGSFSGGVTVLNGAGAIEVAASNTTVTGSVLVTNQGGGDLGGGYSGYASILQFGGSSSEVGAVTFIGGAGDDGIYFLHTSVHGAVLLSTGADAADVTVSYAVLDQSFTFLRGDGGTDPTAPSFSGAVQIDHASVVGGVTVISGSGADGLFLNMGSITGSLLVQDGAGPALLDAGSFGFTGGITFMTTGGGALSLYPDYAAVVTLHDSCEVGGDLTVLTGAGNDGLSLGQTTIHGGLLFSSGADAAMVGVSNVSIARQVTCIRGDGGNLAAFPGFASYTMLQNTGFGAGWTVINGAGLDGIGVNSFTVGSALLQNGTVLLLNGAGPAAFSATSFTANGSVTMLGAGGGNLLSTYSDYSTAAIFSSAEMASFTMISGAGNDLASFDSTSVHGGALLSIGAGGGYLSAHGSDFDLGLTWLRGDGANLAAFPFASVVALDHDTFAGPSLFLNGDGADRMNLDTMTFAAVTILNGAGDTTLSSAEVTSGAFSFFGSAGGVASLTLGSATGTQSGFASVTLYTGDGADFVSWRNISVAGATLINTAGGSDFIQIDDAAFFGTVDITAGPDYIASGADADQVLIERATSSAYIGSFGDWLRIRTGAGDDTVRIGRSGDAMAHAHFTTGFTLDGGSGTDTLDFLTNGNFFDPGAVPLASNTESVV